MTRTSLIIALLILMAITVAGILALRSCRAPADAPSISDSPAIGTDTDTTNDLVTTSPATTTPYTTPPNAEPSETFTATELVRIPWGEGDGQVGLDDPRARGIIDGGPVRGPSSFDIDEDGCLYILDTVNGRVLRYAPDGTHTSTFSVASNAFDLRVRRGLLHIFERSPNVTTYDIFGRRLAQYAVPDIFLTSLHVDFSGNLLFLGRYPRQRSRLYYVTGQPDLSIPMYGTPSKWRDIFLSAELFRQGHLLIRDNHGHILEDIHVHIPSLPPMYASSTIVLGEDSGHNTYIRFVQRYTHDQHFTTTLWKFSSTGVLLATFDVSTVAPPSADLTYNMTAGYRLAHNGSVYLMFPSQDALRIFRFTSSREVPQNDSSS